MPTPPCYSLLAGSLFFFDNLVSLICDRPREVSHSFQPFPTCLTFLLAFAATSAPRATLPRSFCPIPCFSAWNFALEGETSVGMLPVVSLVVSVSKCHYLSTPVQSNQERDKMLYPSVFKTQPKIFSWILSLRCLSCTALMFVKAVNTCKYFQYLILTMLTFSFFLSFLLFLGWGIRNCSSCRYWNNQQRDKLVDLSVRSIGFNKGFWFSLLDFTFCCCFLFSLISLYPFI